MQATQIIDSLKKEFPGKNILALPENEPKEIICETDPASDHPEHSLAISYIKETVPHKHLVTKETYEVQEGVLTMYINGVRQEAGPGRVIVINPGIIHWAAGDWVRIKVSSEPGWTQKDHVNVNVSESAGGIVINKGKIVLVMFDENKVTFPKGKIIKGETEEQTALREVSEETGLTKLEISKELGEVMRPAIEDNGEMVMKKIHLYLMNCHDPNQINPQEETIWLTKDEALTKMVPQDANFLRFLDF